MTVHTLVVLLAVGAAAIAVWTHVRFPRLEPGRFVALVLHLAAAVIVSQVIVTGLEAFAARGSPLAILLGVFGLAFPMLVYAFLVALWVIKLAQRALDGAIR